MDLYLDLNKAQAQATGGKTTKKEDQSVASYGESFAESPSGVANDGATYDDPDKGRKWKHDEEDSLDNELEESRQKRNAKAQKRNLVPTPEEVGKKSFEQSSTDMVKSLNSGLRDALGLNKLTAPEIEFLHLVKGYSLEEIDRGGIFIASGRDRQAFSAFLCERVAKSLDELYRR